MVDQHSYFWTLLRLRWVDVCRYFPFTLLVANRFDVSQQKYNSMGRIGNVESDSKSEANQVIKNRIASEAIQQNTHMFEHKNTPSLSLHTRTSTANFFRRTLKARSGWRG